jgi:hypothetical protein
MTDDEVQDLWDAAVDVCLPYVKPGMDTDASAGLVNMVLAVAVHIWQATDNAPADTLPDGTSIQPFAITSNLVKRYLVLGGNSVTRVTTAAGGTLNLGNLAT